MYDNENGGSIFGNSVFGGSVYAMDSNRSRPIGFHPCEPPPLRVGPPSHYAVSGFGAPLIPQAGHLYPVRDNQAVHQMLMPLIPVSKVVHGSLPIPGVKPIPPNTMYPVGGQVPITGVMHRELPIAPAPPAGLPIGGKIEVYNGPRPFTPHPFPNRPGVFHRPPYVGAYRYELPHSFGPATMGASPDGLGGLIGMGG